MGDWLRSLAARLRSIIGIDLVRATIGAAAIEQQRLLYRAHVGALPVRPLAFYSESAFSQNGEDGVIAEIFRRLGRRPETFVEVGGGDGRENNSIALLLGGARGMWVEADPRCAEGIRRLHAQAIAEKRLVLCERRVTAETVDEILRSNATPHDLDMLSIDIDGNDYWIWKAVSSVRPKLVVMEYNAGLGSSLSWVMKYDPAFVWSGKDGYYGASLAALEKLGREKGYVLIGADFLGINAFFLRQDLLSPAFAGPFTAEEMFQPFRRSFGGLLKAQDFRFGPHVSP